MKSLNAIHIFFLLTCVSILAVQFGHAQPAITLEEKFSYARDLYLQGNFESARTAFGQITDERYEIASKYYLAASALFSNQEDGETLIREFITAYPHHIYTSGAWRLLANHYYTHKAYDKALVYYKKVNYNLASEELFKKGYCQFALDKYDEAVLTFGQLESSFSSYEADAAYFLGYIFAERGKENQAFASLEKAFDSEVYRQSAMLLYVQLLYRKEAYKQVISFVKSNETANAHTDILNLLANAHFQLENYQSAAERYTQLFKSSNTYSVPKNQFRAGFSNYMVGDTVSAITFLKKAAVSDDTLGAYSSYYLGVIYAGSGEYRFAVSAFSNTAKYPIELRENAMFNKSRCLMDWPDYEAAINSLNEYVIEYPTGKFVNPVYELLGLAYARTNNYDLAIDYIESLDRLSPVLKETYQRVSFLKGVTLFNDKKHQQAGEYFEKALLHDMDRDITQRSFYWMGEVLSLEGQLDEAKFYYKSTSRQPNVDVYLKSVYGLAYANYNLNDYESAFDNFRLFSDNYNEKVSRRYLADALLRMGDCQFAQKFYSSGINYYKQAEKAGMKRMDHVYYQIGLLNRYLNKDEEALSYFDRLINTQPNSSMIDQAYFQKAQIHYENGNQEEAITAYHQFLERFPSSSLVPIALLNQAVAFDNVNKDKASISNYKEILERFPRHSVASSALLGLQDKNSNGQFEDFDTYLTVFRKANPESDALENVEFETAKTKYYNQEYEASILAFQAFMDQHPGTSLNVDANYFIGDACYRLGEMTRALVYFEKLSDQSDFNKYEKVLHRLAVINSGLNELESSNFYYYRLNEVSLSSRNKINVLYGLMSNHYLGKAYDSAIYYGNALLNHPKVNAIKATEASLLVGKAAFQMRDMDKAMQHLLVLVSNSPDEQGAEAYYYISKIYFDQARYEKALESLFVLTNNFKNYDRWIGEAFLLMADIYLETNEVFQAKATLSSLVENSELQDVTERAEAKLKEINKTIEPKQD